MDNELPEIWPEPPSILVAHPDREARARMAEELSDYRVRVVEDGPAALRVALSSRPDTIIADIDLPGFSGVDLCRTLRAHSDLSWVPVVITAPPDEQLFEAAIGAGAAEVITTPFSPIELRLRLRNMVKTQGYLRELERKNQVIMEALKDLKESETLLVQAEKLSLLGEMSAGIVHEINNPLNYAKSALHVLRRTLKELEGDEMREELEELAGDVTEGVERVSQIVRDLRAFATKGTVGLTEIDIGYVIRTATRFMGDRLGKINYLEDLPEGLRIRGNENSLCQVLLNLIKNGVEATEAAGRSLDDAEVRVSGEETENGVVVRVRDNGCGLSAEERAKIFEPFFTTKDHGKGMGLGLSICKRILDDHGATIEVRSTPGQFTEFTLRFFPGNEGGPETGSPEMKQAGVHGTVAGLGDLL